MKDFLVKAILEPFAAILFCLVFGVPFVYVGFQTIDVHGQKDDQGMVTIDFTRKHFWSIYKIEENIEDVENASRKTSRVRRSGINRTTKTLVSGVFIETEAEAVRLIAGSSNVNDALKLDAVRSINDFIENPDQTQFSKTIRLSNIFGWFGLPFLILGLLGLIGWPSSIIKRLRDL
jgi:hypothetical protein